LAAVAAQLAATVSVTSKPRSARSMAGARARASPSRPCAASKSSQARALPGTVIGAAPVMGMRRHPRS
jgi:hypothetical protein